jgi:hypothetical protein
VDLALASVGLRDGRVDDPIITGVMSTPVPSPSM